MNKTASRILIAALAAILVAGCSPAGRNYYKAAGSDAAHAADDTGAAVSADATSLGHKVTGTDGSADSDASNVAAEVKNAILASSDIDTSRLRVEVEGNNITLRGSVVTEVENQSAEQTARRVAGDAYHVDDQLQVSTQRLP